MRLSSPTVRLDHGRSEGQASGERIAAMAAGCESKDEPPFVSYDQYTKLA